MFRPRSEIYHGGFVKQTQLNAELASPPEFGSNRNKCRLGLVRNSNLPKPLGVRTALPARGRDGDKYQDLGFRRLLHRRHPAECGATGNRCRLEELELAETPEHKRNADTQVDDQNLFKCLRLHWGHNGGELA